MDTNGFIVYQIINTTGLKNMPTLYQVKDP